MRLYLHPKLKERCRSGRTGQSRKLLNSLWVPGVRIPLSPQKMKREKSCRVHSNNFFPSSSSAKPAAGGRGCATIGSKSPGESIAPPPPHVDVLPPGANSFRRSHRNPRFSYSFGRSNAVACCTGVEPLPLHRKYMQISCSVGMSSLQSACPVGVSGFSRILSEVLPPAASLQFHVAF